MYLLTLAWLSAGKNLKTPEGTHILFYIVQYINFSAHLNFRKNSTVVNNLYELYEFICVPAGISSVNSLNFYRRVTCIEHIYTHTHTK